MIVYNKSALTNKHSGNFTAMSFIDITYQLEQGIFNNWYVVHKGQLLELRRIGKYKYLFSRIHPENSIKQFTVIGHERLQEKLNDCKTIYKIEKSSDLIDLINDYKPNKRRLKHVSIYHS